MGKPSLEGIERAVESVIERDDPNFKKFCLYAGHKFGGHGLKEIGAQYSMRGSAISQASRRFRVRISQDKGLQKAAKKIRRCIRNVEC